MKPKLCEKCEAESVQLVHDRYDENKPKFLCEICQGNPEYLVTCPHCDADICIN